MKILKITLSLSLLLPAVAQGQVTITAADMFNEVGLYYEAYANLPSVPFPVSGLIGEAGGPRIWNFAGNSLPRDQVWRFDYLDPACTVVGLDFPEATVGERKTENLTGDVAWLLFEQVPGLGRKVYGYWDLQIGESDASKVFSPPIIDFPAEISFGDTWATSMTYDTLILGIPARFTHSSTFEVDAFGFLDLPELGIDDALRINEELIISTAIDFNGEGQFTNVDTQFVRNYYWLRPNLGIAAQMTSTSSASPVADNFNVALAFVRTFETNKQDNGGGCDGPSPVTDLALDLLSNGRAILTWSETDCTTSYRVEYSTDPSQKTSWITLGTTADPLWIVTNVRANQARYYRIISQ